MSLSLDQQHILRAEVRKHVDSIGCIYPSVGQAMFEEAAQRLAERICHRMIEPLYEAGVLALRAFESLCEFDGLNAQHPRAPEVTAAMRALRAIAGLRVAARMAALGLVGPPPDHPGWPKPMPGGPLGEMVAASEELCRNALAAAPRLLDCGPLATVADIDVVEDPVTDVPAGHVSRRYHMVVSHNGHPLVLLDTSEFSLPSDVLDWYAKKYAFERSKLTYTYVDQIHVPRDRQGRPIENQDPREPAEHQGQP